MSRCKPFCELTKTELAILKKRGNVYPRADNYNPYPRPVELFAVDEKGMCWFPFALSDDIECVHKSFDDFSPSSYDVKGVLYTLETDPKGLERDQQQVWREAVNSLKKTNRVFMNLSTGFGKSALAVHVASIVKRGKIMVTVFNSTVQKQWKRTFKDFSNAKVQHVVGKKPLDPTAHVYIVGLKKASAADRSFFSSISTLIIDEVDQLPAKTLIQTMKLIAPVYLIGLTATINRDDNMHQALYSYFGDRSTFIKRFITKDFDVIKYQTQFKPTVEYKDDGGIDDCVLTASIAYNEKRQSMIAELCRTYFEEKILVLSKRIEEIEAIYNLLKETESVDYKTTHKVNWDTNCRILIGGFQSCGRGVDIPNLSVLILASSVNHVEQNEGRIRANNNLIIDIVDNHPIYDRRWAKRKTWYVKRGATLFYQIDGTDDVHHIPVKQRKKRLKN